MIVYNPKRWNGLIVIVPPGCFHGSPMFAAFIFGLAGAALAIAIKLAPSQLGLGEDVREESLLDHPAPMMVFGSVVTFLVAFRANLAYSRFWEARTALQRMSSSWADVGTMTIAFDENAKDLEDYKEWKEDFVHLVSLLHALAILCLRCDQELENLVERKSSTWLSVVLSHPSNGSRRTDVPFSTDVEGEGAWDEDDDPMPAGPRSTKRGGARRRRTSDAVEPIAFRRPVMAKSAVKGVTARSGVEARATAAPGASYFPAARSLNSASLVAGKSPRTEGVVASTSLPNSGALAKFKGAGLAVLAQQQEAARLGREEAEPTDQGLSQTLSTVISAEETETTESDNNEPEAQFPPVPGMILPQESDSSSEEDSIPGESSEEDSIPDEIPQAAPEEKPEEKPKEEEPPKPKPKRQIRRRYVANIPSADMVLVNALAKKTGKKAPTSFKQGKSFSKLPSADKWKQTGAKLKIGAKLSLAMQDVQDTAAVADDENTTAEADSPSSVSDVKSPGERHVAVEVSNAILDRVQVLPRPPSRQSMLC